MNVIVQWKVIQFVCKIVSSLMFYFVLVCYEFGHGIRVTSGLWSIEFQGNCIPDSWNLIVMGGETDYVQMQGWGDKLSQHSSQHSYVLKNLYAAIVHCRKWRGWHCFLFITHCSSQPFTLLESEGRKLK